MLALAKAQAADNRWPFINETHVDVSSKSAARANADVGGAVACIREKSKNRERLMSGRRAAWRARGCAPEVVCLHSMRGRDDDGLWDECDEQASGEGGERSSTPSSHSCLAPIAIAALKAATLRRIDRSAHVGKR
eukprot:3306456-Pleurochrysis_carterae.AAC.4